MKVLHVIPGIAWRYGGTTSTIRSLCTHLARLPDLEIELATTDADGPGRRIAHEEIPDSFTTHVFPRTASEQWKYSRGLGVWLRQNARRFDLVHIHALWSYASNAAARAARAADVPYVVRPAGMLSQYSFARSVWKKRLYWQILEQATIRGAAAFHATSSGEREDILRVRPDAKVRVIPNGVDDAAWTTPVTQREKCDYFNGIEPDCPVVLFLSRLHPKKGIVDLLLPAWSRLETKAVLIIAGGPDAHLLGHAQNVHATVSRLGIANRVRLLGEIPANRRWELYDGAELFVLPSHSENFGNVVAESMARGCPVIVTDQVQASEHVLAASAGAIVPCTVQALAEALREYLADASLRERCGNNGRRYAMEHLRWEQIAVCTRELYTATLSSREHMLSPA